MLPGVAAAGSEVPIADRTYRCGAAARWLPRALGASVLVAVTLLGLDVDPAIARLLPFVRQLVVAAGALTALLIVRGGAEVRLVFGLTQDALIVGHGSRSARLKYADLRRLDWTPPVSGTLVWIPAAVLVDRNGKAWRLPGLIEEGDKMIRDLVARAGRSDLDAWADAYRIVPRMGRYRLRVRAGYGLTLAVLAAGLLQWIL